MAKKKGPVDCPTWMQDMTPSQIKRLGKLKKIAIDDETCEMGGDITVTHVGQGGKQGLWMVGRMGAPGSPRPKKG